MTSEHDDFERLLAEEPAAGDAGVEQALRTIRDELTAAPDEITRARHLTAVHATAREMAAGRGVGWWDRIRMVLGLTGAKVALAGAVAVAATGGAAATGNLPDSVQERVADAAEVVGVELPRPEPTDPDGEPVPPAEQEERPDGDSEPDAPGLERVPEDPDHRAPGRDADDGSEDEVGGPPEDVEDQRDDEAGDAGTEERQDGLDRAEEERGEAPGSRRDEPARGDDADGQPDDPAANRPGTDQPGADQPGADQPGADQPGTDQNEEPAAESDGDGETIPGRDDDVHAPGETAEDVTVDLPGADSDVDSGAEAGPPGDVRAPDDDRRQDPVER